MNLPTSRVHGVPVTKWIFVWFLVVTLLGIWPAVKNGQPFFYADTTAYVRGADLAISKALGSRFATDWAKDQRRIIEPQTLVPTAEPPQTAGAEQGSARRVVLAGRSITYGALLYLGEVLGGMWFSIIIQSLIAAYLIFVFTVRALGLDYRYFLISCAFLFIASPLPFFASLLMPDVFAGFLILAFAIIATSWGRLSRFERAIMIAVLMFAVLAHVTHLVLLLGLAALTVAYFVLAGRSQWANLRWLIAIVAACVVIAVMWEATFSFAVNRAFGSPPVRPPFITAKLVSMLGKPAVSQVCRTNGFVVCRFQDRFPINSDSFLWSEDERDGVFSVVDVQTKRLLGEEQSRFALAIIPPNLGQFVASFFGDALRQLTHFGLSEYSYSPSALDFLRNRIPSHYFDKIIETSAARSDGFVIFGRKFLNVATAVGAMITVFLLGGISRPRTVRSTDNTGQEMIWREATYIQLAGIVLNALICGGFSALHDRYQARVIWLIQLCLITGIFVMEPHRRIALFWQRHFAGKREHAAAG